MLNGENSSAENPPNMSHHHKYDFQIKPKAPKLRSHVDQVLPHLLSCHWLRWHGNLRRAGNTVGDRQIGCTEGKTSRDLRNTCKYLKRVWQPPDLFYKQITLNSLSFVQHASCCATVNV